MILRFIFSRIIPRIPAKSITSFFRYSKKIPFRGLFMHSVRLFPRIHCKTPSADSTRDYSWVFCKKKTCWVPVKDCIRDLHWFTPGSFQRFFCCIFSEISFEARSRIFLVSSRIFFGDLFLNCLENTSRILSTFPQDFFVTSLEISPEIHQLTFPVILLGLSPMISSWIFSGILSQIPYSILLIISPEIFRGYFNRFFLRFLDWFPLLQSLSAFRRQAIAFYG